jgi:hypothetical protein
MGKLNAGTFKDWNNGDTMDEAAYEQERALLITAINDNYDRLIKLFQVLNTDGTVKATQNLTTAINFLKFKESSTISFALDTTTSVMTISVKDGSVTTAALLDSSVTTAKIADGNVTTIKVADLAITAAKLATDSVQTAKIVNLAVTSAKIADGNVTTAKVANLAITSAKLADGSVTHAKLDPALVTQVGINDHRLQSPIDHPDGSIPRAKIDTTFEANIASLESELTNNQTQDKIIKRALSTILTDQDTPLWMVKLLGLTRVNLPGKDGNCEDTSKWGSTINVSTTLDSVNKTSGNNGIKLTATGTTNTEHFADQTNGLSTPLPNTSGYYIFVAEIKPIVGQAKLRTYNNSGTGNFDLSSTAVTDTSKFNLTYIRFVNTGATSAKFRLQLLNSSGSASFTPSATAENSVFDGVRAYQITQAEYDMLPNMTAEQIASNYPYVDSMQPTLNPWIKSFGKNLNGSFHNYTIHANAQIVNDYELKLVATGAAQGSASPKYNVLPSQSYTVSLSSSIVAGQVVYINEYKADGTTSSGSTAFNTGTSKTITTNAETAIIQLNASCTASGTFTFTNPSLVLGSTALDPFEPQNTDISVIEGQFRGNPITGVYDSVTERDGHYWHNKRFEHKVLDGKLGWTFDADYTGYKRVKYTNSIALSDSETVIKYDGKVVQHKVPPDSGADQSRITGGYLYLTIADTDTGFFDAWTGTELTESWLDAYFNGWKYTGTADKLTLSWVSVYDGASAPTQTLAYVSANRASGMTDENAYQLEYQLADSVEIVLGVVGGVSLHDGNNIVEFGEGMIVKEPVTPILASGFYRINHTNLPNIKHRTNDILVVYKGGNVDNLWKIEKNTANGIGGSRAIIPEANFDKTAQYYVTYLPLDKYLMTSNVIEVETEYATNLKSVVARNTQDVADGKNAIVDLDWAKANRFQENWIAPTLLNGWIEESTGVNLGYYKDEFGMIHLHIRLKNGTNNTNAFILPKGYRPKSTLHISLHRVEDNTYATMSINTSGNCLIYSTVGTGIFRGTGSFRAEG